MVYVAIIWLSIFIHEEIEQVNAKVSVIIPCYCSSLTLDRALESVVSQALLPNEIILVDDASPDGGLTIKWIKKFSEDYSNQFAIQTVFLKVNGGAAVARNAGWSRASQPYVAFLDADDSWHYEKLSIQYRYMEGNPEIMISGHQCLVRTGQSENSAVMMSPVEATKVSAKGMLFKNPIQTPTVMIRGDAPFHFREGQRFAEDLQLWQMLAFSGHLIVRIELPLAFVHKSLYGDAGLSAKLWEMEKGELSNYLQLYRADKIGVMVSLIATTYSLLKCFRRIALTLIRRK